MEPHDKRASEPVTEGAERRLYPRFPLQVDISVRSRTRGLLKGHTVDLSESGVSAMLTIEVPLGELVELEFSLPHGEIKIFALVRQRNAFRYGFHFIESDQIQQIIRPTCRQLAVEQSLHGEP